jgi:hypothetical protein
MNRAVSGTGTTEFKRNVTVNADIETAIDIVTYNDGVDDHYANIIVADGNKFGTSTQAIRVFGNNALTMADAEDLQNTVSLAGTINLESGTLSQNIEGLTIGTDTTYGTLSIAGDTIFAADKTAVVDNLSTNTSNVVLTNKGTITVNETLTNTGTITNDTGSTLNLLGGAVDNTMKNAGTINGTGNVKIGSYTSATDYDAAFVENTGDGSIAGQISIATNSQLITSASKISDTDHDIANAGTLTLNGGNLTDKVTNTNGTVEIAADTGTVVVNENRTGAGEIDVVASLDDNEHISDSSLQSETYSLWDTIFYDEATSNNPNNNWYSTVDFNRESDGTTYTAQTWVSRFIKPTIALIFL